MNIGRTHRAKYHPMTLNDNYQKESSHALALRLKMVSEYP